MGFDSLHGVASISGAADTNEDRLVASLTHAAWEGDRSQWDVAAASLPEAVVLACNQALAAMPAPESVALGADGRPMTCQLPSNSRGPWWVCPTWSTRVNEAGAGL